MSLFRKVAGGIGDVAKKAAPLAAFVPGVGPVAAAAMAGVGAAAGKLNDKRDDGSGRYQAFNFRNVAPSVAGHAAGGYAGAKFLPGISGVLKGGGTAGTGAGGGGMFGGIGSVLRGNEGANAINLLTTGAGMYGAHRDRQLWEDDRDYGRSFDERAYGDARADTIYERERRERLDAERRERLDRLRSASAPRHFVGG